MIKLAYNRRIQRPSLRFLNPNIEASNPQQQSQGNPELDPELTDNYELGYSTFIKGTTLNFTGFYRNTTGSIQAIRNVREDGNHFYQLRKHWSRAGSRNQLVLQCEPSITPGSAYSFKPKAFASWGPT